MRDLLSDFNNYTWLSKGDIRQKR